MAIPIEITNRQALIQSASTSLNSKVISLYADTIAPIVVDAVLKVADLESNTVDLNDIRLIKKLEYVVLASLGIIIVIYYHFAWLFFPFSS